MVSICSDNMEDNGTVQTQRSTRSRRSNFDFSNTRNSGWRLDDNASDIEVRDDPYWESYPV